MPFHFLQISEPLITNLTFCKWLWNRAYVQLRHYLYPNIAKSRNINNFTKTVRQWTVFVTHLSKRRPTLWQLLLLWSISRALTKHLPCTPCEQQLFIKQLVKHLFRFITALLWKTLSTTVRLGHIYSPHLIKSPQNGLDWCSTCCLLPGGLLEGSTAWLSLVDNSYTTLMFFNDVLLFLSGDGGLHPCGRVWEVRSSRSSRSDPYI